jgi:hypothetical protein
VSTRWQDLPKAANAAGRTALPTTSSYAEERPAMEDPEDMPLIWPILTPAELGVAEPASTSIPLAQLAAALAAILGLAALILHFVFGASAGRKPRADAHDGRRTAAARGARMPTRKRPRARARGDESEATVRGLLRELQRRRDEAPCADLDPRLRRLTA